MTRLSILALALLSPPDIETIEHDGPVEIDCETGQLLALLPPVGGKAATGCKIILVTDSSSGVPIVVDIRCAETLGAWCSKSKSKCARVKDGTTPGGAVVYSCVCGGEA